MTLGKEPEKGANDKGRGVKRRILQEIAQPIPSSPTYYETKRSHTLLFRHNVFNSDILHLPAPMSGKPQVNSYTSARDRKIWVDI